MQTPHTTPSTWPRRAAGAFAETIRADSPEGCEIALVGLPDDLGVRLNNGRPGAAEGPGAFRAALARFGSAYDAAEDRALEVRVYDAGDIQPARGDDEAALRETHDRVTEALRSVHAAGLLPVCIGGGHDLTFPTVRALSQHISAGVGGINIDPHLDVRETVGSGMPYRALIEGEHLLPGRFVEWGAGRFSNSEAHTRWLKDLGGRIILHEQAEKHPAAVEVAFDVAFPAGKADIGFVSVDLDAIDSAFAPGVSAVNPRGLPVQRVLDMAHRAGEHPAVRHFDIMELSPPHDSAGRTARIAALVFLTFLAGYQERPR